MTRDETYHRQMHRLYALVKRLVLAREFIGRDLGLEVRDAFRREVKRLKLEQPEVTP